MSSKRESRVDFILNRFGASKASAQLKIFLALIIFGIASALFIYGVSAEKMTKNQGITEEYTSNIAITVPSESVTGSGTAVVYPETAPDSTESLGLLSTDSIGIMSGGPTITINTPANTTYGSTATVLNVTTSAAASSCWYSLNDAILAAMDNTSTTDWDKTVTANAGLNNVTFYCWDTASNLSLSSTVYFTIDTTTPIVTIAAPANTTYGTSATFNATTNEAASMCMYSFDGAANVSMGNTSTTSWNYTNSGMTNGLHNVVFYCNNTLGNWNSTTARYFTVDATAPTVTIVTPANMTYTSASLTINVTTNEAASSCNYSLNGAANVSMGNTSTTSWNKTVTASEGINSVTFYCWDLYSNLGVSSTRYFTVDTTSPTITIVTPANTTYTSASRVFNITTSEAASSCSYSFNGAANVSMGNISTTMWNKTVTASEGLNNVIFYCLDVNSNPGSSSVRYFTVDTTGPIATIVTPANTTYNSTSRMLNITTSEAASSCWYILNGADTVLMGNTSTTSWNKTVTANAGLNNVTFYCVDVYNNFGAGSTRYFSVDIALPTITIVTPANTTYGASVTFNATTSEAAGECRLSLDGAANVSMDTISATSWDYINSSMTTGLHNVIFYCDDTVGNWNSTTARYFTVDATNPTVTIATPANTTYTTTLAVLNVTTSEAASSCEYSINDDGNASMGNTSTTSWNKTVTANEGINSVTFYCWDLYSNLGVSSTRYFTVDTTAPTVTVNTPANTTYGTSVVFNVSTNEAASSCWYSLDGASIIAMGNTSTTSWNYTNSSMTNDAHHIVFYCWDVYSNLNDTVSVYFTVDTIGPTITINTPANTTYGTTVRFNVSTNEASSMCMYSLDSAANVTMTGSTTLWTNTNSSMTAGLHDAVFYCNDTMGNWNSTAARYFTVDATAPTVTINTPENTTYTSAATVLNATTSEAASSCSYSLNGATNVSMDNTSTTSWNKTVTASEGINNVTFYCLDLYNNLGVSSTRYFTVDTTGPAITIVTPANTTYDSVSRILNITTDETAASCWYSLNGASTVSMGNTSTTSWNKTVTASEGINNVTFYCLDLYSNLGSSSTRYFTVDTTSPTITIVTPANTTYGTSVVFNVTTNEAASMCMYSRDGAANVSMGNTSTTSWNYTNSSMTAGLHNVKFYCNDTMGNWNSTAARYFTVDATNPTVTINTPENTTYDSTSRTLNITTSKAASSCSYSLNGATNVSMDNTSTTAWDKTVTANEGLNNVTFYCLDLYNNPGSNGTRYFTVTITINEESSGSYSGVSLGGGILPNVTMNASKAKIEKKEQKDAKQPAAETPAATNAAPAAVEKASPKSAVHAASIVPLSTFGDNKIISLVAVMGLITTIFIVLYKANK